MDRIPQAARQYLAAIGKRGGQVTTNAKAEAARRNGRKGGRPKKEKTQ